MDLLDRNLVGPAFCKSSIGFHIFDPSSGSPSSTLPRPLGRLPRPDLLLHLRPRWPGGLDFHLRRRAVAPSPWPCLSLLSGVLGLDVAPAGLCRPHLLGPRHWLGFFVSLPPPAFVAPSSRKVLPILVCCFPLANNHWRTCRWPISHFFRQLVFAPSFSVLSFESVNTVY